MKKINWILIIGMVVGTLYYTIVQYNSNRILTYLSIIPVLGGPMLLNNTKYELKARELSCYYLFVFFAYFLGSVVNLYNFIWWYDVAIHFSSGIFTYLVGLFLLDRFNIDKNNQGFRMFFCFSVVMMIAGLWELFEFGADNLLGMQLQHNNSTGVVDTMIDMLAAFSGGTISIITSYIFKKK